jgi:DNA-binding MarR family transcriptional regulator
VKQRKPLEFDPIAEARRQWTAHGWRRAADGMAVVTSVMRAQQIFLARVEALLRPLGLTFARYEVLMLLSFSRTGALPMGKVGQRLQVHPASVTNAINRLEADGFVERVPHPDDGRTTLARITARGRDVAERATDAVNDTVFARIGLRRADASELVRLLEAVREDEGDFTRPTLAE